MKVLKTGTQEIITSGAVWSGSVLFAQIYQNLRILWYVTEVHSFSNIHIANEIFNDDKPNT